PGVGREGVVCTKREGGVRIQEGVLQRLHCRRIVAYVYVHAGLQRTVDLEEGLGGVEAGEAAGEGKGKGAAAGPQVGLCLIQQLDDPGEDLRLGGDRTQLTNGKVNVDRRTVGVTRVNDQQEIMRLNRFRKSAHCLLFLGGEGRHNINSLQQRVR